MATKQRTNVERILAEVKRLAIRYHDLTGKPLGVTGEIAEYEAARILGLELCEARSPGYDAVRRKSRGCDRIQIKGRRPSKGLHTGRMGGINLSKEFDTVMLVLLDQNFDAAEIWEATRPRVEKLLQAPGSKARNERGAPSVRQFINIAKCVWRRDSK